MFLQCHSTAGLGVSSGALQGGAQAGDWSQRWDGRAGLDKREQVLACNPHVLACSSLRAVKLGYALQSKLGLK